MALQIEEARIFLCHASEDKPKVREIYQRLKKEGLTPWLDKEDLLAGQIWADEIPRAIKTSTFVIIFFSGISVSKRGYVQKEFKLALDVLDEIPEGQIFIIPARLDECNIPARFSRLHYVDLFEDRGVEKMVGAIKQGMLSLGIIPPIILRSEPLGNLSPENVNAMIRKYDFYCADSMDSKAWANPGGKGIQHVYGVENGDFIIDKATRLMWQHGGSVKRLNLPNAQEYINELNDAKFAGCHDWRLPTLEEAMAILEPKPSHSYYYFNSLFYPHADIIWTSDMLDDSNAWFVNYFSEGYCSHYPVNYGTPYVRAIRSIKGG